MKKIVFVLIVLTVMSIIKKDKGIAKFYKDGCVDVFGMENSGADSIYVTLNNDYWKVIEYINGKCNIYTQEAKVFKVDLNHFDGVYRNQIKTNDGRCLLKWEDL